MLEITDNSLGDALSLSAKYCQNEEDHQELISKLLIEVDHGAMAIGFFGSRTRYENQPDSDIDVLIFHPNVNVVFAIEGLRTHEYLGTPRPLNKGRKPRPWIDIIRIPTQYLPQMKLSDNSFRILESTVFLWADPIFDMNLILEAIENGREYQLQELINQIDENPKSNLKIKKPTYHPLTWLKNLITQLHRPLT